MDYQTERKAYKEVYKAVGVVSSKATHTSRGSALRHIDSDDVSDNQQRRMGRWGKDKMVGCYLNSLPKQAMRSLAGFYHQQPGSFYLKRAAIDPPEELKKQIFPDVEKWLAKYDADTIEPSIAGHNFLDMLITFRTILLQDAAILKAQGTNSNLRIFKHAIFKSAAFLQYQQQVQNQENTISGDEYSLARSNPLLAEVIRSQMAAVNDKVDAVRGEFAGVKTSMHEMERSLVSKMDQQEKRQSKLLTSQINILKKTPLYFGDAPGPSMQQSATATTTTSSSPSSSSEAASSSSPTATDLPSSSAPAYTLSRKAATVHDVWEEYEPGLDDCPSVKQLESSQGTLWRKNPTESRFFIRRKVLYDELERIAEDEQMTLKEAAGILEGERKRGRYSLSTLSKMINNRNKNIQ
ncbi:unnamed protein product [Absidia cylindrospora]